MTYGALLLIFSSFASADPSLDLQQKVIQGQIRDAQGPKGCDSCAAKVNPSKSPSICDDLSKFTCAPGEFDDGTGKAKNGLEMRGEVARLAEKMRPETEQSLENLLNKGRDKSNISRRSFMEDAIQATGSADAPACQDENSKAFDTCLKNVAQGLASIAIARVFPPPDPLESHWKQTQPDKFTDLSYVLSNPIFVDEEQKLHDRARDSTQNKEMLKKIETDIFPRVKKILIQKLSETISDEHALSMAVEKIKDIKFSGSNCPYDDSGETDRVAAALFVPNAFYDPDKNSFRYCNGFLIHNKSEFQIVNLVGHELAHAIDPCFITQGPSEYRFQYGSKDRPSTETEYPVKGLISCLRSEESIHARRGRLLKPKKTSRENQRLEDLKNNKRQLAEVESKLKLAQDKIGSRRMGRNKAAALMKEIDSLLVQTAMLREVIARASIKEMSRLHLYPSKYPPRPILCSFPGEVPQEQIGESVADWYAAEILPEYMAEHHSELNEEQLRVGYSNVWRGNCFIGKYEGALPPNEDNPHSHMHDRINRIILAQPKVRAQMGCPVLHKKAKYCNVEPVTTKQTATQ